MQTVFGYNLPKEMHPEFGAVVKAACDKAGTELLPDQIFELFSNEYLKVEKPYMLKSFSFTHESSRSSSSVNVSFKGNLSYNHKDYKISGSGNGPIDAFFKAIKAMGIEDYTFVSYNEQAVSSGSDSMALAYITLKNPRSDKIFGVGMDSDISVASIKAVLCAINRVCR
jgi:2-isopropylmalate synthase